MPTRNAKVLPTIFSVTVTTIIFHILRHLEGFLTGMTKYESDVLDMDNLQEFRQEFIIYAACLLLILLVILSSSVFLNYIYVSSSFLQ